MPGRVLAGLAIDIDLDPTVGEITLDKASISGVIGGIALVVTSILLGGSLSSFIQVQGILVVAGGTFAATAIAFPTSDLKLLLPVSRRVFNDPGNEMIAITQYLVTLSANLGETRNE